MSKRKACFSFNLSRHLVATPLLLCLALQGCATNPNTGQNPVKKTLKDTFASDDPCASDGRNVGILIGSLVGAFVGNKIGDGKVAGTLIGLGLGGALGAFIGSEVDKRQCELSKIEKKYGLQMEVMPIAVANASGSSNSNSSSTTKEGSLQKIGLSVSVVDQEGKPQFNSGADVMQPDAKLHFNEIAKQYSAKDQAAQIAVGKPETEKNKIYEELRKKRILLIGHTDDTGNTKTNAELSERRAKTVARLFKSQGVEESQLYYQGAGETMPIADNATPEGRAKNRRVEIVDLTNEDAFKLYLQNRRAKTEYYRPVQENDDQTLIAAQSNNDQPNTKAKGKASKFIDKSQTLKTNATDKSVVAVKEKPVSGVKPNGISQLKDAGRLQVDFGGEPVTEKTTNINVGKLDSEKPKFSLISEAKASNLGQISSCRFDRPRDVGAVKSLKDGVSYATSDYLPGVYNSSWAGQVNGHLVALTHVAVLRDGNMLARKPDLLIYTDYKGNSNTKSNYSSSPDVNVYKGDKAMLYRVFDTGPVRCMDIVIPNESPKEAVDSKIYYNKSNSLYSTSFNPKLAK
jgi:outer membrane protein OmpA-like peptidoglycan-associated protein